MKILPQEQVPLSLIENTPIEYPLCKNEDEASLYIKLLLDPEFIYTNGLNYDLIDYEKLIYIEDTFAQNNSELAAQITKLKSMISYNYIFKNKYLTRLKHNIPNIDKQNRNNHYGEIHLPPSWLRGL